MGEQQSQKTGLRSDAQKQARARKDYEANPQENPVAGAHGEQRPDRTTDREASLKINTRKTEEDR